jgi:hypothetical protein
MSQATLTPDAFMTQQQSAAPPPSTLTPDTFMAQQAATAPAAQSAPEKEGPSIAERYGKSTLEQSGLPTSMEDLKAAQPSIAEMVGGPAVTAGKVALGYGNNLLDQGKAAAGEVSDAYHNIKEGQPLGENLGKMGAAASDFALKGVLAPVGGPAVAQAGQDFSQGKTAEALGDVTAAVPQVMTALSPFTAERAALPGN